MRIARLVSAVSILAASLTCMAGCAADSSDPAPDDPMAEAELTRSAGTKLLGVYEDGQGMFARLELRRIEKRGAATRYEFSAEQVVMCVRAPCPTQHLEGTWYAGATVLALTPTTAPRLDLRYVLRGAKLEITNSKKTSVLASLEKKAATNSTVAGIMGSFGLTKTKIELPQTEIDKQARQLPSEVAFDAALRSGLESFLEDDSDPESPLGLVADVDADDPCHRSTKKATLKCFVDSPDATIGMLKVGESAEQGEKTADAWIFTMYLGNLSDHGHWAIVDRKGVAATYNYGFN